MKNAASLLDEIINCLRSAPVPEMPMELAANCAVKPRSRVWYLVPASALAASIVGVLVWRSYPEPSPNPRAPIQVKHLRTPIRDSEVMVRNVDLVKPLTKLEICLGMMDVEIVELQSKAVLLDVRRTADELLTQN